VQPSSLWGGVFPASSVAVFGSASSTRPELTAIALALETCPSIDNLTIMILTDSLDSLTTLFSLRRADFPLSLHRQLYTHIVQLLNQRHAAGVIMRLVKVKAHCGEPLNETADALASAEAEVDGAPMTGELHLDPWAVHFYIGRLRLYCSEERLVYAAIR
jgi:ribonuclease HI